MPFDVNPGRDPGSQPRAEPRSPVQRAPEASARPRVPISPFQLDAQREDREPFAANGSALMRRAATAPQQSIVNPFDGQLVRNCHKLSCVLLLRIRDA
jgi:hypothetical protein